MDPTKTFLVKTFGSVPAAELAATQLRSRGIPCVITSDDAGGMFPPLGAIKLLVSPSDAVGIQRLRSRNPP